MRHNFTFIEGFWLILLNHTMNNPNWYWVLITFLVFPRWGYIFGQIQTQLDYQKTQPKNKFTWLEKRRKLFILQDQMSKMFIIQSKTLGYTLTKDRDQATKFKYDGLKMAQTLTEDLFKTDVKIF